MGALGTAGGERPYTVWKDPSLLWIMGPWLVLRVEAGDLWIVAKSWAHPGLGQ